MRHHLIASVVLAGLIVAACDQAEEADILGPGGVAESVIASQGGAIPRFPEMLEVLPAVRIADGPDHRPELTDDELVAEVELAEGRVIIGFKPPGASRTRATGVVPGMTRVAAMAARALVEAHGGEITLSFRHSSAVEANIPPAVAPELRRLPIVDYIEASFPGYLMQATPPQDTTWGVKKIRANAVWSHQDGNRGHAAWVTILDSGLDSIHRWSSNGDGPESLGLRCYWVEPDTGPNCYGEGHGAHIAGLIAAKNNAYGVIGIAHQPFATESIKVCKDGQCSVGSIVKGLDWVIDHPHPRRIVNMSIGLCNGSTLLASAVSAAASAGVLLIGSAGNTNVCSGQSGVLWPARYAQVMAVSGTLENDEFAAEPTSGPHGPKTPGGGEDIECPDTGCDVQVSCTAGSRYGTHVEIAAPFWAHSMWRHGQYRSQCGTSMSAAMVSGAAALVWTRNPSWTAQQVRDRLTSTAIPYSPATHFGSGRVDALNAIQVTQPPPPTPLNVQIYGPTAVKPSSACEWSATANGVPPLNYAWKVNGSSVGFNSPTYTHTAGSSTFDLSVVITDAASRSGSASRMVSVSWDAPDCLDM
jgi:subtilisin